MDFPGNSQPSPRAGRSPPEPPRMVGKVHLQRHHPLRAGHLRPGGRGGAERHRARRAAATVPPTPRCLPNAARRGGGLFAHAEACGFGHRSRHRTLISGSMKVRMFTRAKGRCECCGAHEHQRALEVDQIVPRNHGGSDDLSNVQALCFRCNAGKRWEERGGLCVLRAGGQRPGASGERTGAVHRRCRSGDAWPQPGDPAAAWG